MSTDQRASVASTKLISALFFLSGMTGLSYEVIWFKQFSHVWGSSNLAMASVVGAFLLGLGLGARLTGPLADRITSPVRWYGICEIGIGILALLIPLELNQLSWLSAGLYSSFSRSLLGHALIRVAMTFLVIGPPCVLMGATLPLLVSHFSGRGQSRNATGWLYGINTLGAAFGCYLVGFHMLPEFGLERTNLIIAVANLSIGTAATLLPRRYSFGTPMSASENEPDHPMFDSQVDLADYQRPPLLLISLSAMLTGIAALLLQTVWNRQLALVLGSSTYAFSAMLLVVLAGIGAGSLLSNAAKSRCGDDGQLIILLSSASIITAIAGIWLIPFAADFVGVSTPLRSSYTINSIVCIVASAIVELPAAMTMGMLFPALVRAATTASSHAGRSVGGLYGWNTLGTLVGSVGASLWMIPEFGTRITLLVAFQFYLAVAVSLIFSRRFNLAANGLLTAAIVGIGVFAIQPEDPLRTNRGMFYYGYERLDRSAAKVLYFKEGAACNVMVTQQGGSIAFRVNGKFDGSNSNDMSMQAGLAYLPRFIKPDAKDVLVIGFGTGTTSGASVLFPETRVTCCEIEPAVVAASRYFSDVNHRPQDSDRFHVVYDDARAYVQGTEGKYDLILSEPSNPWIAGVSNLFTTEFYQIASRKLLPNGIFAQWIQTYAFTPDDYAMVVQSMSDVFPSRRLIRISSGDTILLGANDPLAITSDLVLASQRLVNSIPAVKSDLERYFGTSKVDEILLTRLLLDEAGLERFITTNGNGRRNRDGDLQLEFRAARHLYGKHARDTGNEILSAAGAASLIDQFDLLQGDDLNSQLLNDLIVMFTDAGIEQTAVSLAQYGLGKNPQAADLLASQMILAPQFDVELLHRLLGSADPTVVFHANRAGVAYWERKQYAIAAGIFEKASKKFPESATIWTNLALNHERLGDLTRAGAEIRRAQELDPANLFIVTESKRIISNAVRSRSIRTTERPQ